MTQQRDKFEKQRQIKECKWIKPEHGNYLFPKKITEIDFCTLFFDITFPFLFLSKNNTYTFNNKIQKRQLCHKKSECRNQFPLPNPNPNPIN